MIPAPGDVHYARTSKTATFSILDTVLPLVAKIELENGDGTWSSFNEFTVGDATYGEVSASCWKAPNSHSSSSWQPLLWIPTVPAILSLTNFGALQNPNHWDLCFQI